MKTIYNVSVKMECQDQCDRMKQFCIDNKLPYSGLFTFDDRGVNDCNFFLFHQPFKHLRVEFSINSNYLNNIEVTELEFLNLFKNQQS